MVALFDKSSINEIHHDLDLTDPMPIRPGVLTVRNRGTSFLNFPFVNTFD